MISEKKTKILLLFILVNTLNLCGQNIKDTVYFLKEIEISAKAGQYYMKDIINREEISVKNKTDIGEYLKSIPNIGGIRRGGLGIDPVLRGLKFSQVNIAQDNGIKTENACPNRMDPASSHVEIETLESIEVFKGPFSLRYGPVFGGIIKLNTEMPIPYKKFEIHARAMYGFESNWNGQKEHLMLKGGNKFIYFLAGGGYDKYGAYRDGRNKIVNADFSKYNFTSKLGLRIDDKQSIIISGFFNRGTDIKFPALPMDETKDNTNNYSLDYKFKAQGKIKQLKINLYRSDVRHEMDNIYKPSYAKSYMIAVVDAINTGGRAEMELLYRKSIITLGTDYENIYKNGERKMIMTMNMAGEEWKSVTKTNLWKDAVLQNTGVFAEYNSSFANYNFVASIRADFNKAYSEDTLKIVKEGTEYFNETNSHFINISASAMLSRLIAKNMNLSLAVGRGVRSPNMLERYIKFLSIGYDNYEYLGNPLLKPEINNEADLTLRFSQQKLGVLYVNGFVSYIKDYIGSELLPPAVAQPNTLGLYGVKKFYNADYAVLRGFEFGYNSPEKNKLTFKATAAYTKGTISKTIKYIITNKQVTDEKIVENDALPEIPPLEARINVAYKLFSENLLPELSLRIVNAQNYVSEAFYESKTSGFFISNFSLKYKSKKFATLIAGINNIFNKPYYEHLNRRILGSSENLYEPGRIYYFKLIIEL